MTEKFSKIERATRKLTLEQVKMAKSGQDEFDMDILLAGCCKCYRKDYSNSGQSTYSFARNIVHKGWRFGLQDDECVYSWTCPDCSKELQP